MSSSASQLNLNIFDLVVLGVLVLSALVAFFRGFIRELLSLGAWVGAAVITLYFFPHATDMMKQHVKNEHVAAGAALAATYITALIVISILNSIIIRYVKTGMEVGILDNFLGLIFGALRGAFIISLGYLMMTSFISKNNPPDWLATSFTRDYVQAGADLLVKVAPQYLSELEGLVKQETDKAKDKQQDMEDKGYKPADQNTLNRLMDSTIPQGADFHRGQ